MGCSGAALRRALEVIERRWEGRRAEEGRERGGIGRGMEERGELVLLI